jgi:GH43 family beta-xylosidase
MQPLQHEHQSHLFASQAIAAALVGVGIRPDSHAAMLPAQDTALLSPEAIVAEAAPVERTIVNPILPTPAADPWVIQHGGIWYALLSTGRTLELRAAPLLSELTHTRPLTIWRAPKKGPYSRNVWAPEMHFLDGKWYIYFAADDGNNDNHRMWVLEAENPAGPWINRGMLDTSGWAIDATILEEGDRRYCIWSGWPGRRNVQQNLYIAEMKNPWTLAGSRVLLAEPTEHWERVALPLCEGPQILRRGSKTFIIYSASGSWTEDYCLGMLVNEDGDFMNRASWVKHGPVFKKTDKVWGVGHCCFAQHPTAGDLIIYHAKTDLAHGWDDRNVRVQPFTWNHHGLPEFGAPVPIV